MQNFEMPIVANQNCTCRKSAVTELIIVGVFSYQSHIEICFVFFHERMDREEIQNVFGYVNISF